MDFVRLHRTCIYSTEKRFSLFSGDSVVGEVATGACAVREFIMQSRHLCFTPLALDFCTLYFSSCMILFCCCYCCRRRSYIIIRRCENETDFQFDRTICVGRYVTTRIKVNSLHSCANSAAMRSRSSREHVSTFSAMEINIWMYF